MKEFIVKIKDVEDVTEELLHFLYEITLDVHAHPQKLLETNYFVPVLDFDNKKWTVYFGTEDEVKAIDAENWCYLDYFISSRHEDWKNCEDDERIWHEVVDYTNEYWYFYLYDDDGNYTGYRRDNQKLI